MPVNDQLDRLSTEIPVNAKAFYLFNDQAINLHTIRTKKRHSYINYSNSKERTVVTMNRYSGRHYLSCICGAKNLAGGLMDSEVGCRCGTALLVHLTYLQKLLVPM